MKKNILSNTGGGHVRPFLTEVLLQGVNVFISVSRQELLRLMEKDLVAVTCDDISTVKRLTAF